MNCIKSVVFIAVLLQSWPVSAHVWIIHDMVWFKTFVDNTHLKWYGLNANVSNFNKLFAFYILIYLIHESLSKKKKKKWYSFDIKFYKHFWINIERQTKK